MQNDARHFATVRRLFDRLVELPPTERGGILDAESTDPAIRSEVERLLHVHTDDDRLGPSPLPTGFEPLPASVGAGASSTEPLSWIGLAIGRYRLLRRHAVGGMGVVYEAEQEEPRRRVALKLIRPERLTEAARVRFRREAEALGRLQHVGIATILESGMAADPLDPSESIAFCAMEFIEGEPITVWCRRTRPPLTERVRLLERICHAIEHAHVRGVVHRDLKPANILVSADGQPKVVDFGIARTLDDETGHTADGALLGTLGWMSPEQLRGDEADARSDVYALGLLAYELLGDRPAFATEGRGVADAITHLLAAEAPPLGRSAKELAGDLELVVATAMAKDRARRYPSAAAFAADLEAVRASRPVSARAPSLGYRSLRFAKRHRVVVAAALAIAVTLVGAAIWAGVAWRNESRSAERTRRVNAALLELLAWADPVRAGGPKADLLALLDEAGRIGADLSDDDEISYTLHDTLGQRYGVLGAVGKSIEHHSRAVDCAGRVYGRDSAHTADSLTCLGQALRQDARHDEAIAAHQEALRIRRDVLGAAPGDLAECVNNLGAVHLDRQDQARALPLFEEALRLAESDPRTSPVDLAVGYTNLSLTYIGIGRIDDAIATAKRGSALLASGGGDELRSAAGLSTLAGAITHAGRLREAADLYTQVLATRRRLLPATHEHLVAGRCNLGAILIRLGQREEATRLLEENIAVERAAGGRPSKDSRRLAFDIASTLWKEGRRDEAVAVMLSAEHDPSILGPRDAK